MKFLDISLHIGSLDLQRTFQQLGHQLDIWSLSDHCWVHGWERAKVDVVNQYTWRGLNQQMCDDFYNRYKDELKEYDGFVTFYPMSFCLLYERFGKPIISYNALRYELPFMGDASRWNWLTAGIRRMIDSGQMIPVVNDKLDQQYFQNYVERDIELVSAICDYPGLSYIGDREENLVCSKFERFVNWIPNAPLSLKKSGHSWEELIRYKSLIYIPYVNVTYSIFEQYMMNIPLLFPTHDFLIQLWRQYRDNGVMSELSHCKIFGLPSKTPDGVKFKGLDLNDYESEKSFSYWSSLSDFYDDSLLPHIQYFENMRDLEDKLNTVDFRKISVMMKKTNRGRKASILSHWKKILERIR